MTKAKTRSGRRKNKRSPAKADTAPEYATPDGGVRPTDQRKARGVWAEPGGMAKALQPVVDMAGDVIGALLIARTITSEQEQAARQFQKLRAAYLPEIPGISAFKSCLADHVPGYDDGDGDEHAISAYRRVERALDRVSARSEVLRVCDANIKPANIKTLRDGLDAISAM